MDAAAGAVFAHLLAFSCLVAENARLELRHGLRIVELVFPRRGRRGLQIFQLHVDRQAHHGRSAHDIITAAAEINQPISFLHKAGRDYMRKT